MSPDGNLWILNQNDRLLENFFIVKNLTEFYLNKWKNGDQLMINSRKRRGDVYDEIKLKNFEKCNKWEKILTFLISFSPVGQLIA